MIQFCDTITKKSTLPPMFYCGKLNLSFESLFTSFAQILYKLYEFQILSDILGHQVLFYLSLEVKNREDNYAKMKATHTISEIFPTSIFDKELFM